MILVTVGMQLGFDRLIEAMDKIAPLLDMEVIAQTGMGTYAPRNMTAHKRIAPEEFERLVSQSKLVVSHAGIGTVLTAMRFSKPIVLFPRRLDHAEHRNDHQVATVNNLDGRPGLLVAHDVTELEAKIAEGLQMETASGTVSPTAAMLQGALARYIEGGEI